jgi:hypothetical protein
MQTIFDEHTRQDLRSFEALNESIQSLDEKIDQLLIREAHRAGEFSGVKKSAIMLSVLIASIISVAGAVAQALV